MFTQDNNDSLLTIDELCQQLFISPTTAYRLLQTGEITAFKLGSWKIPTWSVKEYINNHCKANEKITL